MITNIQQDIEKSKALVKMAVITLERLEKTDLETYPSNTLVDYYDIIHKLLESTTLKKGIKIRGEGAHQELIDYCSKELDLSDQNKQFLQLLRDYRNRISYEGFMVKENFIVNNVKTIKKIVNILFKKHK